MNRMRVGLLVVLASGVAAGRWLFAHRPGQLYGWWYRITGHHPDPDVDTRPMAPGVSSRDTGCAMLDPTEGDR